MCQRLSNHVCDLPYDHHVAQMHLTINTYFPVNHGGANGVFATCHTIRITTKSSSARTATRKEPPDNNHRGVGGYVYNSVIAMAATGTRRLDIPYGDFIHRKRGVGDEGITKSRSYCFGCFGRRVHKCTDRRPDNSKIASGCGSRKGG